MAALTGVGTHFRWLEVRLIAAGLCRSGCRYAGSISGILTSWVSIPVTSNVTRVDLCEAVYREAGLSRSKSSAMVELVLKEITASLEKGETVKLASFGSFIVRTKNQRLGRNPKTGTQATISSRRVIVFKSSAILKQQINGKRSGTKVPEGAERGLSAP